MDDTQRHTTDLIISVPNLTKHGFVKTGDQNYMIDFQTHYLELMPFDKYWYPIYAQYAEMSHEHEQRVSLRRIKYMYELDLLFFVLRGEDLYQYEKAE